MARRGSLNTTHFWRHPEIPGLSLMCADLTAHDYPRHVHDAVVIAVTEAGGSVIESRGAVEEARDSSLFVFNPLEPHAGRMGTSKRWRYRSFYLARPAMAEVRAGLGIERDPFFVHNRIDDPTLRQGFLALHGALEKREDPFREAELLWETFGILYSSHGLMSERVEDISPEPARLRAAVDCMRDRHAENLLLTDIGAAVGLSPFQLISLVKRSTGLTPHAYLTQIRLHMACRLLLRGVPISEAAVASGFYDQSALNRNFKRCYGITPLQFARADRRR